MGLELNSCHLHADDNDDEVTRGWKRFGYQRAQSYYPSGEKKSGRSVKDEDGRWYYCVTNISQSWLSC